MGPREEYEEPIASLAGKDLPKTVQKSWKKFEKRRKFDNTVHTGEMENPVSEKSTEKIESTETCGLYEKCDQMFHLFGHNPNTQEFAVLTRVC